MAIKPNRNTNYPYLNESDQDALEDIASQDPEILIDLCFDRYINEAIEIRSLRKRNDLFNKQQYKRTISRAYRIYFECITIRQLPLSNPNRPSIADCKKERDKLIKFAEERYEKDQKLDDTRATQDEQANYDRFRLCIENAQGTIA